MKTIADDLGVTPMTVSNAFNRPQQLSADLRERILARARVLGYSGPDPLARGLRQGRSGIIGVVSDTPLSYAFDDAAAAAVLGGICSVAEGEGLGLLLVPPRGAGPVDGMIVYSVADAEPLLALTRDQPTVIIDQPKDSGLATVGIDDEAAAYDAARHLKRLGHERIGIVAFGLAHDGFRGLADRARREQATFAVSRARVAGYERALGPDVPLFECDGSVRAKGREAARALAGVTAILAMSDVLALGVLEAAPELSVVGFDDIPEAQAAGLTTIRQDHRAKGEAAARLLLSAETRLETLPYELISRRSARAPSA